MAKPLPTSKRGGALTSSRGALPSLGGKRGGQQIFQGGRFSDILDFIQIPQFALTGAVTPGLGIGEAVKKRVTPGEVMGLTGVPRFVVDVATDPFTWTGVGAATKVGKAFKLSKLTSAEDALGLVSALEGVNMLDDAARLSRAIKAGSKLDDLNKIAKPLLAQLKPAATLAGAAKTGERAALTLDVPFAKSLQGIPLVPQAASESFLGALTKIGQPIRRIPGIDKMRVLPSAPKGATLEEIERLAKRQVDLADITHNLDARRRALVSQKMDEIAEISRNTEKLKKAGVLTDEDLRLIAHKNELPVGGARANAIKLSPEGEELFQWLSKQTDDVQDMWKAADGVILEDARLSNVLTKAARDAKKARGTSSRLYTTKTEADEAARYVKFKSATGEATPGTIDDLKLKPVKSVEKFLQSIKSPVTKSIEKITARQKTLSSEIQRLVTTTTEELAETNKIIPALKVKYAGMPKGTKIEIPPEVLSAATSKDVAKIQKEIDILGSLARKKEVEVSDIMANLAKNAETLQADSIRRGAEAELFYNKKLGLVKRVKATTREAGEAMGDPNAFRQEPFVPLAVSVQRAIKKKTGKEFMEQVSERFGKPIAKGGQLEPGMARSTAKELKGLQFPEELVAQIDATYTKFSNIEEVNDFLKLFDKVQNFWKGTATFINPAFHTRNGISNQWQIYLADGLDPKSATQAFKMMRKKGDLKALKKMKIGGKNGEEVWNEFVEYGLGGTGWIGADIDKQIKGFTQNPIFRAGGNVGSYIEDMAKLQLYINRLNKGYKTAEAAKDVRKYLFDYGDLSDLERNTFKRIFPFYTWTRNNIPLQVASLISKPGKFSPIAKAKRMVESMQEDKPMDNKYLPPWLQEGYTIFFGKDGKGAQRFFNLEGFLPAIDVTKIGSLERAQELPFELMSPLIKTPIELMSNYDFFFEKQISEFSGQRKEFFQQEIPAKLEKVLRSIRPFSEFERLVAPRTKDAERSFADRLGRFLLGKIEKIKESDQKGITEFFSGQEVREIESDIRKAKKKGGRDEMKRLEDLIRNIEI